MIPEYLNNRTTYKQHIAVIKAEARQHKRTKQLNNIKEISLVGLGFVLFVVIIGLAESI